MMKLFTKLLIMLYILCFIPMSSSSDELEGGADSVPADDLYPLFVQGSNPIPSSTHSSRDNIFKGFVDNVKNGARAINPKNFYHHNKSDNASNDSDEIVNIVPTQKIEKRPVKTKLKELSSNCTGIFTKKPKQAHVSKIHFEKHSLTEINESKNIKKIKEQINNEEYFKHDTKNKLYLDRFKTYGDERDKSTFYSQKNITENQDGDIQVNLDKGIDIEQLIEQIEQCDPDGDEKNNEISLSLRESIAIALAKHPNIMSAKLNTQIYKSRIIQEWAGYFPNISAGMNWGYNYTRYHGYHEGVGYNNTYVPDISAGMMLFDFGKIKAAADIAQTDYDASRYDLQDSINVIIYDIKSAYYNVLFAQKQVEIYNKTIEDFELQQQSAEKFFSIGKKPQIDVIIADYNTGNAKLNLVKANNTLENAKVSFANTIGLPEFANFNLDNELFYNEYNIELEELLQDAFNIRPDLLSYEKSLEANFLAVRKCKRMFTPDLMMDGGLSYSDVEDVSSSNYRVKFDLSYNNFNFLQIKKEYDIAKKSYEKSLADYESKRQSVYLEVKQAYIDYCNSKQSVKQADLNVQQAKAQHYHASGRYKAGYGDAIEIKDAENTYLNAQLAYYQALLDYNLSIAQLEKVVGRPIEQCVNNIEDVVNDESQATENI